MSRKIIIAAIIVIIAIIAIAVLFWAQKNFSTTGGGETTTGTLPSVPMGAATTTPPAGDTITLGTSQGSVVVKNFYKTADFITQDGQTVAIHQTSTYSIAYNVSDSSFVISILATPLEATREAAEAAFLNSLGISKQDACKLSVYEGVPASVSDQYVGQPFPLSFCPGAVGL